MEFEKSTNFHSCADDDNEVASAGYGDRVGLWEYTAVTEKYAASIFRVMGFHYPGTYSAAYIYRVIKNDCRGYNNLPYTIHLR